jgi:hypothetical protein
MAQDRADPRKVEMKVRVLKQEEKEICNLLKDLLALKVKLRPFDQQHLDLSIRPLSDEVAIFSIPYAYSCCSTQWWSTNSIALVHKATTIVAKVRSIMQNPTSNC